MLSLELYQTLPNHIYEKLHFPHPITIFVNDCYFGPNHSMQAEISKKS